MNKNNTVNYKNSKISHFIDFLKNNLNDDQGFNLNSDHIFSFETIYDKNLSEKEKEYIYLIFLKQLNKIIYFL